MNIVWQLKVILSGILPINQKKENEHIKNVLEK